MLFVLASIIVFGYLMNFEIADNPTGLEVTAVVLVLIAAYARRNANIKESLIFGVGLSIGTVLVFKVGLGQPLPTPLWDQFVQMFLHPLAGMFSSAGRGY